MKKVGVGEFVKRQTAESRFSHFTGTWEMLEDLVTKFLDEAKPGYRDGVLLVPVPVDNVAGGFFSGVVEVTPETPLQATFEARREGEDKHIVVVAKGGKKLRAMIVDVVVYHRDVLKQDGDEVGDHEWEIVSINARPTIAPEPMHPLAMARNMLNLPGGTKADYTAQQFAEAIVYWSKRAMRG